MRKLAMKTATQGWRNIVVKKKLQQQTLLRAIQSLAFGCLSRAFRMWSCNTKVWMQSLVAFSEFHAYPCKTSFSSLGAYLYKSLLLIYIARCGASLARKRCPNMFGMQEMHRASTPLRLMKHATKQCKRMVIASVQAEDLFDPTYVPCPKSITKVVANCRQCINLGTSTRTSKRSWH